MQSLSPADLERARFNMIEQQIRPWEVLDPVVLQLLSQVKREQFVPAGHKALAFVDMEIPLPGGQRMLAPRVEARLMQELQVQPHERVLEIGTGSGYMAALLGARAREVLTVELRPELVRMAQDNLRAAGIGNVDVRQGDGATDLSGLGSFDVIVLSGSVAQVPERLLRQLNTGGRLIAIVGEEPMMRATIVTRTGEAAWQTRQPWDTVAPRLEHFPERSRFVF